MKTQTEIVSRINEIKSRDFLGFEISDLLACLDFEHAKPFFKEGTTKEEWAACKEPADRESILARMKAYMPFAWEKANDQRGLSASRSMSHYSAWTWLAGDEAHFPDLLNYEYYGKDNLVAICEHYGWNHAQWDDGIRSNG